MSESKQARINLALVAATAWAVMPVAWLLAAMLDSDGGGDAFTPFYLVGWVALVVAGVAMLLAILRVEPVPERRRLHRVGIAVHSLGVLTTVVLFWAVFLWAALYAIAAALYAIAAPQIRRPALVIAGAMAVGVASMFVLTALEVGAQDEYGDYPIAWVSAYVVAGVGGAIGNVLLGRSRASSDRGAPTMV